MRKLILVIFIGALFTGSIAFANHEGSLSPRIPKGVSCYGSVPEVVADVYIYGGGIGTANIPRESISITCELTY